MTSIRSSHTILDSYDNFELLFPPSPTADIFYNSLDNHRENPSLVENNDSPINKTEKLQASSESLDRHLSDENKRYLITLAIENEFNLGKIQDEAKKTIPGINFEKIPKALYKFQRKPLDKIGPLDARKAQEIYRQIINSSSKPRKTYQTLTPENKIVLIKLAIENKSDLKKIKEDAETAIPGIDLEKIYCRLKNFSSDEIDSSDVEEAQKIYLKFRSSSPETSKRYQKLTIENKIFLIKLAIENKSDLKKIKEDAEKAIPGIDLRKVYQILKDFSSDEIDSSNIKEAKGIYLRLNNTFYKN